MGLTDFFGGGQPQQQVSSSDNTQIKNDPGKLFKSKTAAYNPSAPAYPNMPRAVQVPAFVDGLQNGLTSALSRGFGGAPASYQSPLFQPQTYTQMSEPLSVTMRAFGLEPTGPGMVGRMRDKKDKKVDFNPQGFQQWGQTTGSPYLDYAFGLKAMPGVAPDPSAPTAPPPSNGGGGGGGGGNNNGGGGNQQGGGGNYMPVGGGQNAYEEYMRARRGGFI